MPADAIEASRTVYDATGAGAPEALARATRGADDERADEAALVLFGLTPQDGYLFGAIQRSGGLPDGPSLDLAALALPLYWIANDPTRGSRSPSRAI